MDVGGITLIIFKNNILVSHNEQEILGIYLENFFDLLTSLTPHMDRYLFRSSLTNVLLHLYCIQIIFNGHIFEHNDFT